MFRDVILELYYNKFKQILSKEFSLKRDKVQEVVSNAKICEIILKEIAEGFIVSKNITSEQAQKILELLDKF